VPGLVGDAVEDGYLGASRTYTIAGGKILTDLVGTPIETAVYKLGDSYVAARSNEFGYADYTIVPAVGELAPMAAAPK
jgi:hypothetical protein